MNHEFSIANPLLHANLKVIFHQPEVDSLELRVTLAVRATLDTLDSNLVEVSAVALSPAIG
jgi:hypothetical protein